MEESVKENMCDGILLSGGLDTSILAFLASRRNLDLKAFTVAFNDPPDLEYSKKLAVELNLEHHIINLSEEDLIANIKPTIEILHSFDPMEIRNSIAIYSGLNFAKEYVSSIMTGDGADEVFYGYSYLREMSEEDLKEYSSRLYKVMQFSSKGLGRKLGIRVNIPYLSKEVKDFAIDLDPHLKIRDGIGKWILRKAYENDLAEEFIWREKTPIEYGSGTSKLTDMFDNRISDDEFMEKRLEYGRDSVKIRDKEHLHYYKIYRRVVGGIPSPKGDERVCKGCGTGLPAQALHCKVCGNNENGKD
ncbi:MAG: asparagine synthase C-terminal domain-containing protein [Candidatus Altiarchaeales archaeon]|nr:asparagine synthase C-terminal domain-containing protein [Candidatus Altiarchaeales archaeon]